MDYQGLLLPGLLLRNQPCHIPFGDHFALSKSTSLLLQKFLYQAFRVHILRELADHFERLRIQHVAR
jgi:hypothetical protein